MPPDPTWPIWPVPLFEPRGLWVIVPLVLAIAFAIWADRRWPGK